MHIFWFILPVRSESRVWLQSAVWGCRKLVHISANCQAFCQNSPNPFPPPPTALNRRKRTEAELQSYKKRGCRLLWRTVSSIYTVLNRTLEHFMSSGCFLCRFFTIAATEAETDSRQKLEKLRSGGRRQLNCSGCWPMLLWCSAQSSNQHIKAQNYTRGFFPPPIELTKLHMFRLLLQRERGSWGKSSVLSTPCHPVTRPGLS